MSVYIVYAGQKRDCLPHIRCYCKPCADPTLAQLLSAAAIFGLFIERQWPISRVEPSHGGMRQSQNPRIRYGDFSPGCISE